MIKVGVIGALGKMGREVVKAILNAEDMELVMAVDIFQEKTDIGIITTSKPCNIYVETNLEKAITEKKPHVVIDFTQPAGIFEHVKLYLNNNVKAVIGTTGLKEEQIAELKKLSKEMVEK